MESCIKCGGTNLVLESRELGKSVRDASQVALVCGDCGRWQKWCPKHERYLYLVKELSLSDKFLWLAENFSVEVVQPTPTRLRLLLVVNDGVGSVLSVTVEAGASLERLSGSLDVYLVGSFGQAIAVAYDWAKDLKKVK